MRKNTVSLGSIDKYSVPMPGPLGLSWSQGVFNQPWRGTSQYRFPILPRPPEQTPDIQKRWMAMRGQRREQQYFRQVAIESNLLELTFALTSKVRRPNELLPLCI
jgi:hypothetical protein